MEEEAGRAPCAATCARSASVLPSRISCRRLVEYLPFASRDDPEDEIRGMLLCGLRSRKHSCDVCFCPAVKTKS